MRVQIEGLAEMSLTFGIEGKGTYFTARTRRPIMGRGKRKKVSKLDAGISGKKSS